MKATSHIFIVPKGLRHKQRKEGYILKLKDLLEMEILPPGISPKLAEKIKKKEKAGHTDIQSTQEQEEGSAQQLFSEGVAYVSNFGSNNVSVVDISTARLITNIPVGQGPAHLDMSPDRRFVYVANFLDATVSVIRTFDNRVINTINLNTGQFTAQASWGVKVSRNGRFVYVANFNSNNISVIDAQQQAVVTVVPLQSGPSQLEIPRGSNLLYTTLPNTDQVVAIDMSINLRVKTLAVGDDPEGITASPTGSVMLVANQLSDTLSVINSNLAEVSPSTIATGDVPTQIAFTRDGTRAFVTNQFSDTVSVIDITRHTQLFTIPVGNAPTGIKLNRSNRFAVVTNAGDNTISIIDTRVNQVMATVPVGDAPQHLVILEAGL